MEIKIKLPKARDVLIVLAVLAVIMAPASVADFATRLKQHGYEVWSTLINVVLTFALICVSTAVLSRLLGGRAGPGRDPTVDGGAAQPGMEFEWMERRGL